MKFKTSCPTVLLTLAATLSTGVAAHPGHSHHVRRQNTTSQDAAVPQTSEVPTVSTNVNGVTVSTNTTMSNSSVAEPVTASVAATDVNSTVLIIARDATAAYSAYSGLNGYAIPYEILAVPQAGAVLPTLTSDNITGNYGAIVVISEVSYDYNGTLGYQSALSTAQWAQLYQYQVDFGVRMVRIDAFPGPDFGTTVLGDCCDTGVEQLISISDTSSFPTAGIVAGAGVSTQGLYHYPASISNSTIATEFAQFAPATGFPDTSTAAVINNINGRQQMVFFTSWATDWSQTSNFLQHSWITWVTRGLYTGYRRVNLGTQVDDMFLQSALYVPANTDFRITTADLDEHKSWITTVNAKLPTGSSYFMEICHNGNGNIEEAENTVDCGVGSIEYGDQTDTPLEWVKPIGTGTDLWPDTPLAYPYTTTCLDGDSLKTWFSVADNLNAFAHISHTFTHEDENNATYFDVSQEISWNQAWLNQSGIASAERFSPKGIVPPAITGLHNGDALRAWMDNGIVNVVGDNTRPVLLNTVNEHWPLISTVEANGYAGVQITPRWATNIYYNCNLPNCTVQEWIDTSAGSGDWDALLTLEKNTNTRHLLGLHHDPFMFHQANLNYVTAGETTINGVTAKLSLLQAWVETVVQEMIRLTTWPIISLKHDDIATAFANRMARDACTPSLAWSIDATAQTITGVTVSTNNGNTCGTPIPVTVPGSVTSTAGFTTEQVGSDPLTIWVEMTGSPVSFTLSSPISF